MVHDISDRKQAEESLREAHDRALWLARFPDESPNPVLRVSADGSVLYCNPSSDELPGWACDVGQPLDPRLFPLVSRAMAEGQEEQEDVEIGGMSYSVGVVPFPEEGYANVYGRDITERKRDEEAIRRAKDEWERTFHTVPDLIAIVDEQYRAVRANHAMANRLGRSPKECVGLHCYALIHGTDNPPTFWPHNPSVGCGCLASRSRISA